jgi:transcriptional regulator with XRE-family HTH domain
MKTYLHDQLERRRQELGMSLAALVQRSCMSRATVERIFNGLYAGARAEHLQSIAKAMGAQIILGESMKVEPIKSAHQMRQEAAREKARQLAAYLQGTSALEAQGMPMATVNEAEENFYCELMSGPPNRLWAA